MNSTASAPPSAPPGRFRDRFLPLFLLGLLGVATLPLAIAPMVREQQLPPEIARLPMAVIVALSLINPTLLLAIGTALGTWLAHRLGLVSHIVRRREAGAPLRPRLRAELALAFGLGIIVAIATTLLDLAFAPHLGAAWTKAAAELDDEGTWRGLVGGMLYGGITEELMLRWGFLTLVAWIGWRLFQRRKGVPGPGIMWSAIILAAVLFGLGHLPAVAAITPLTSMLVVRTVLLNALAGVVFGWLFWRRSLESAMLAHASAHVGFALMALAGVV
ncbi:MAG: CPBP family intramembrane metalloprotease [Gemmatimonadota bacterium]|nr:CPBP family intramembrane metalloprotease [Gemmatimonadota bacterium]